jgi:ankyrin repeat protein
MDFDQVESLKNLSLMRAHGHAERPIIDFVTFLNHFSQGYFSVNWKDERGRTPLHNAVMKGDFATVDLLLSSNSDELDINSLDNDLYSPLGLALREDKIRIAYKLLD